MATEEELNVWRQELAAEDPYDRLAAAYRLAQQGVFEAPQVFLDALKDEDADVRLQAIARLGEVGPSWAVAPIGDLLYDDESQNRHEVAVALLNVSRASVAPWLIKALANDDADVREDGRAFLLLLLGDQVPI